MVKKRQKGNVSKELSFENLASQQIAYQRMVYHHVTDVWEPLRELPISKALVVN